MTSLTRKKPRQMNDDNIIPLINIVFLMLIFFLVAGQIATHDNAVFTAPQSTQQNQLDDYDLTILLAADGSVWINDEPVTTDLSDYLPAQDINPESQVILKVDAYLMASTVDPVISALEKTGIQRLKLITIATQ